MAVLKIADRVTLQLSKSQQSQPFPAQLSSVHSQSLEKWRGNRPNEAPSRLHTTQPDIINTIFSLQLRYQLEKSPQNSIFLWGLLDYCYHPIMGVLFWYK